VTSNILESQYFFIQETHADDSAHEYKYAVNIKDDKIDIIILFCKNTATMMAENLLGIDEVEEDDIKDALKESINIVVGNLYGTPLGDDLKTVPLPAMLENISAICEQNYEKALLYYNEEPLKILLKIE
jgi:hypothetical protein